MAGDAAVESGLNLRIQKVMLRMDFQRPRQYSGYPWMLRQVKKFSAWWHHMEVSCDDDDCKRW